MSADFWAGYISGAVGIIIGNPLDVLKVKLQAGASSQPSSSSSVPPTSLPLPSHSQPPAQATRSGKLGSYIRPFLTGTAAPVLGYGALNALLFVSYNRTEEFFNSTFQQSPSSSTTGPTTGTNLYTTFLAGAIGGLATWVVSTPTELIKCRVQLASARSSSSPRTGYSYSPPSSSSSAVAANISSWSATKAVLRTEGIRGLYFGGLVTALRDSIGYGFYFWSYELSSRWMAKFQENTAAGGNGSTSNAASVLLCGGLAGIVTWASIFPLDVIKTRVQTQMLNNNTNMDIAQFQAQSTAARNGEREPLLAQSDTHKTGQGQLGGQQGKPLGAWEITKQTYAQGGIKPFFRGLGVCSVRAFIVNAVQWAVYEWIMAELGVGRNRGAAAAVATGGSEAVL